MYSIIRTSITKQDAKTTLTDAELTNKVVVMSRPFANTTTKQTATSETIPMWVWFALGAAALVIIGMIFFMVRKRKKEEEESLEEWTPIETEILSYRLKIIAMKHKNENN